MTTTLAGWAVEPTPGGFCEIQVDLASNPYAVVIGAGSLGQLGSEMQKRGFKAGSKVLVVSNPAVEALYAEPLLAGLNGAGFETSLLAVPAGEDQKTPATVALIHDAAFQRRLERGSVIVALGGGVVGDMAGFAAATWLRGIAVVQVPTTLLAMVDAAIGGKTGVNHPGGKNLIGAFHQPRLVLIDPSTLASLPAREFRAGMAEVIKYGVIGDPELFAALEAAPDLSSREAVGPLLLETLLERSAAAKARVVAADEREGGLRAILNYGHTLGHGVETLCGYGTFLHGEAVALGMLAAGDLAVAMGLWTDHDQARQRAVIAKAGLPLQLPKLDAGAMLATLQSDKKVKDGQLRFVLPTGIGQVVIRSDVSAAHILQLLNRPEA
ncbi:3-dehydroquinate synthase [Synechococcus sp. CS-602]|uniref:3-dehydroquinate synthase n=1 Tax=Synechococcaceae TaxID=1890426 RepID=UPI0008FF6206|nr:MULTISPECIES: 3-dehydroquinate synthase [Synechococcaceae]MCT4364304.1 3-dehydroquinate synthase [Candidatus Regnicoccus frigidus MAG-AL1]APD48891.1 3-dehydroquinate synthase [Synechococcus sp. SynAce01]MCT0202360.1 3-dehydroquinate synthase [Synechococcus sp. CS-603]MCT0203752.1 3-dehydroquinate synthase [Synechococcus sp. CS-602]MCT0246441.1 3-dehydroquinate synthase [Synechococcus sp. CS-601]